MHDGIFGVLNGLVEIPKTEVGFKEERLKLIEITVKNTADLGPVIRLMPIAYSPASQVRVCHTNQIKSINWLGAGHDPLLSPYQHGPPDLLSSTHRTYLVRAAYLRLLRAAGLARRR